MATRLETAGQAAVRTFRWLFLVAALYDGILGAVFFFLFRPIFERMGIELPNNTSYIHLTAGFIFVQGLGYWFVYRDMLRNMDLVKLGVVYKAIYSLVALYYLAIGQLPNAVFAWFAVCDVLFIVGFVWFLVRARPEHLRPVPQS